MSSKFKVQSPKSKAARNLRQVSNYKSKTEDRKPKNEQSKNIIFGVLPVLEALRANSRKIEKILVAEGAREKRLTEIFQLAKRNNVLLQKTSRENLARAVENGANYQGVVAIVAAAEYADADELLREIAAKENSLTVILDGVEDPRNLGAILRVAECAGADGVFIPERRAVGLTETVAKASAGAAEYVKIAKARNLNHLIDSLKSNNVWVVGAAASGSETEIDYNDWDWTKKTAIVLGSEGKGLRRLTAEKCDALVRIPMQGKIESLNVSVAAGVILFEALRQRTESKRQEVKMQKERTKE